MGARWFALGHRSVPLNSHVPPRSTGESPTYQVKDERMCPQLQEPVVLNVVPAGSGGRLEQGPVTRARERSGPQGHPPFPPADK